MQKVKKFWIDTKLELLNTLGGEENQQNKLLWTALILSLALTGWLGSGAMTKETNSEAPAPLSLDTYIPPDHTLVPIRVADYESLDQVFGNYGVVDLYTTPILPNERARLVARKVKLIRSGKSQSHFGVLVKADEAWPIQSQTGEFSVSIRNPKAVGTQFVKAKAKTERRQIIYDTEE